MPGARGWSSGGVAEVNPWGITDTEAALMDALCEHGRLEAAADAVGITIHAARSRLRCACLRMAGHKPGARHVVAVRCAPTIVACIRWAQWTAQHEG